MKKLYLLSAAFLLLFSAYAQSIHPLVTISNPFNRKSIRQVISIPWKELQSSSKNIDTSRFTVVDQKTGKIVPHQWETLGTGKIQYLLIKFSLTAHQKLVLGFVAQKKSPPADFVFGRYVPERKDDFAWENDRIAFRMYGKALQFTHENAHGIDVWVKRTNQLIINKWYRTGDYHADHGDGLDYYSVGATLGAGDISFLTNDSIFYPGNYDRWKILDNGPLRFSFQLIYDSVYFKGQYLNIIKTISLDAGAQLNRITVAYQAPNLQQQLVIAGIVLRNGWGILRQDEQKGIITYWEPSDPSNGTTGIAVIDTSGNKKISQLRKQAGMQILLTQEQPHTYFAGACWSKAGKISSAKDWDSYIGQLYEELRQPLTIIYPMKPIKSATIASVTPKTNQ